MSIDESDAALRIVESGRRHALVRMREAFSAQLDAHPEIGEVDPDELDRLVNDATDRAGASLWRISLAEGAAEQFGLSVSAALAHPAVAAAEQLVDAPAEPAPAPAEAALPEADLADEGWWTEGTPEPVAEPEPAAESEPAAEPEPEPEPDTVSQPELFPEPEPTPEPIVEPAPTAAPAPAVAEALRVAAVHNGGIATLKSGDKDIELRLSDAGLDVIKRSSGVAIGRLAWNEVTGIELDETKHGLRGRRVSRSLQVHTGHGNAVFELPDLSDEESAAHLEPALARLRSSGRLAG